MRPRIRTVLAAAGAAVLIPGFSISAAFAAAPGNDTPAGATTVGALPTGFDEDTTQATTDALDASLNQSCGAPATNASVWYSFTATSDAGVVVSVADSDYSAGVLVTEGDPSLGNVVDCGPGTLGVATTPGTTYYVMAFSDTATQGGHLHITFDQAPPPPDLTATANARGVATKGGTALVSGTYTCTNADGEASELDGTMTQRVGRVKITGYFSVYPLVCDGTPQKWTAEVVSDNGLFRGGKAASVTFGYACGTLVCADGGYTEQVIQLSGGSGKK